MNDFETYFDASFQSLKPQKINLDTLLKDKMFLVCGDFYGIQKFIFDGLSTKNASKMLRAKSAYVQIFTEYLAKYICYRLDIDEKHIVSANAGKFEILSPKSCESVLVEVQKSVDSYFIKHFYGLSGVSLCSLACTRDNFNDPVQYKKLRTDVAEELETKKLKKFNLQSTDALMAYEEHINNETLCKICNIRKIENDTCKICDNFIKLGKRLSSSHIDEIVSSDILGIDLNKDFIIDVMLTEKIKSYVLFDKDKPVDFSTLAEYSCHTSDSGMAMLGVLKADVDGMGKFLEESDVTESFESFDMFSKTIDNFFSLYIPKQLMKNKYKHTYTVFAGGDDLFLLGAWDEIIDLSKEIHNAFETLTKGRLSISFGISITKPSVPIRYLAEHTEDLLEAAKDIDDNKDAISMFDETVKWSSYLHTYTILDKAFDTLNVNDETTTFLYKVLHLTQMAKKVKLEGSIYDTIWKSKLSYVFYRTMSSEYEPLLSVLNKQMEVNPQETKMYLSEYIYKRRR